jgi:energy-converting hydrogenase Eha subunit A
VRGLPVTGFAFNKYVEGAIRSCCIHDGNADATASFFEFCQHRIQGFPVTHIATKESLVLTAIAGILSIVAIILAATVSPAFVIGLPLIHAYVAWRMAWKITAMVQAAVFAIGVLVVLGWTLGSTLAERDNAMSCPTKSEISLP